VERVHARFVLVTDTPTTARAFDANAATESWIIDRRATEMPPEGWPSPYRGNYCIGEVKETL